MAEITKERTYTVRGSEGFILEPDTKPAGIIVGLYNNRNMAGEDDIVYTSVGKDQGAKGGETFSVFRKDGNVIHPISQEILGAKITPLGTIQLTDLEKNASRAIVTKIFQEIAPGAFLLDSRENKRREIPLKMTTQDLTGCIVESLSGTRVIASGDVVFIDLGSNQGAEPGNMLYIVRDVTLDSNSIKGFTEKIPQELLGALVIVETGTKTATAIVVKSIDVLYKGDRIVSQVK